MDKIKEANVNYNFKGSLVVKKMKKRYFCGPIKPSFHASGIELICRYLAFSIIKS